MKLVTCFTIIFSIASLCIAIYTDHLTAESERIFMQNLNRMADARMRSRGFVPVPGCSNTWMTDRSKSIVPQERVTGPPAP